MHSCVLLALIQEGIKLIGGYVYRNKDAYTLDRLSDALDDSYSIMKCGVLGILFFDNPYSDSQTSHYSSDSLSILTQDILVTTGDDGKYRVIDVKKELPSLYRSRKTTAFEDIASEYRLIVLDQSDPDRPELYLLSNRAGNGRIYFHQVESGILFSSDIRVLLKILPYQDNDLAMYAMLKYGAIPEPLTISKNIEAVPAGYCLRYDVRSNETETFTYFQFEFQNDRTALPESSLDESIQPAKHVLMKSAEFLQNLDPAILLSGGIDSSLLASYMNEFSDSPLRGIHCTFGDTDPELEFAQSLAKTLKARLYLGKMETGEAQTVLHDAVRLTGHPFSDFSSLPIVFILQYMKNHVLDSRMLIEGNGGDDCFGFPDLATQSKIRIKHFFPKAAKDLISTSFQNSKSWKWKSKENYLSKLLSLVDVNEGNPLNYFLVLTPINFLNLDISRSLDRELSHLMDKTFNSYCQDHERLSYRAKITIRQLMHVNSRRWAAKAFSVGESLGIRIIYPYIWSDVLTVQGQIPWQAKINRGVVKWPLKRLLEEYMPGDFIYRKKSGFVPPFAQWLKTKDFNYAVREPLVSSQGILSRIVPTRVFEELLDDALRGESLRHSLLNFLWGAIFTEMWVSKFAKR
jgi:asparagine synthetase B (glutamine-hydrolysing)